MVHGVDIMEEAVEICKLRLFLKMASVVEPDEAKDNYGLEPLPDIDFNIRAGNTLIGYATEEEVRGATAVGKAKQLTMMPEGYSGEQMELIGNIDDSPAFKRIKDKLAIVDAAYEMFRRQQVELGGDVTAEDKKALRGKLSDLDSELNRYLAGQYGISAAPGKPKFDKWLDSHKPFHWLVEFYGIMKRGGFDVIIGNPPYVELATVRSEYTVGDFATVACGNLYALVCERAIGITRSAGRCGLIVPVSIACTERMVELQNLQRRNCQLWYSSYDMRPSSLFSGVSQRLTIALMKKTASARHLLCGGFRRWCEEERANLLPLTQYTPIVSDHIRPGYIPKIESGVESSVWMKTQGQALAEFEVPIHDHPILVHRIVRYFIKALDFVPHFWNQVEGLKRSDDYKPFYFSPDVSPAVAAIINSSFFYWHWRAFSDGFHCGYRDIRALRLGQFTGSIYSQDMADLATSLMADLRKHCIRKTVTSKATGRIEYDEFRVKLSKPIIDDIDQVVGKHYGFTDEELDFIINYDIKYRMGINGGGDTEEDE